MTESIIAKILSGTPPCPCMLGLPRTHHEMAQQMSPAQRDLTRGSSSCVGAFAPGKLCRLLKRLSTGARPVLHDPDAAPHPSLSRDPDRNDWSIHEDGQEIGRLYEDLTASRPEIAWFWSITVMGPARHNASTDGRRRTRIRAWSDIYSTLRLPLGALRLPLIPRSQILAIAIVTDIAINADRPVREREIMLRLGLPKRHLRSLLHALVRNGIVTHRIGRSGGYELARAHYLINADDIVHAVADIDKVIDGSKVQSLIGTEVVIPALRQAEKALSEALRCLTIDMLAHSAMNKGLVVSGGQHLTRKHFR